MILISSRKQGGFIEPCLVNGSDDGLGSVRENGNAGMEHISVFKCMFAMYVC